MLPPTPQHTQPPREGRPVGCSEAGRALGLGGTFGHLCLHETLLSREGCSSESMLTPCFCPFT